MKSRSAHEALFLLFALLLLWLFPGSLATAQDIDHLKPHLFSGGFRPVETTDVEGETDPEIPEMEEGAESFGYIEGIALVGHPDAVEPDHPPAVSGVEVLSEDLLVPEDVLEKLESYIAAPLTINTVDLITNTVMKAYRKAGYPVVEVGFPEQNISTGILQVVVVLGRVGEVRVEGNAFHDDHVYLDDFLLTHGEVIETGLMVENLRLLNRSPYRQVAVEYEPGAAFGEADVILSVTEEAHRAFYAGFENTGHPLVGSDRLVFGGELGRVFGWDHTLAYRYTVDVEFERLHGHSLAYRVPLPYNPRHELQWNATHVRTHPEIRSGEAGRSTQMSLGYLFPLKTWRDVAHDLRLGFDFKSTDNNFEFGGVEFIDPGVEIYQFHLGHAGERQRPNGELSFHHAMVWSPGELTGANSSERFGMLSPGADASYFYWTGEATRTFNLPRDMRLLFGLEGQWSNQHLLPVEAFQLGGTDSVRGFTHNLAQADRGMATNAELHSPAFPVLNHLPQVEGIDDRARFFGFYDYGRGHRNDQGPGQDDDIELSGAGIGIDYHLGDRLQLRGAYGWQLGQSGVEDETSGGRWDIRIQLQW